MKARARTAVTTLALLAAAAGALWWAREGVDRRGDEEVRRREAEERLFAFEAAAVRQLTVEAQGTTTVLARAAGGWRIPALDADADRAAADAIAERLAGLRRKALVPAADAGPGARAAMGLAPPRVRVQATLEGGQVVALALGGRSGFDGSLHVETGTGQVALVAPSDLEGTLDRSTFDLRDHRLLPLDAGQVARLELSTPTLSLALVRQGGRLQLDGPAPEPADAEAVEGLLATLRGLRAIGYQAAAAPPAGQPRLAVAATDAGGLRRALQVFAGTPAPRGSPAAPLRARLEGRAELALLPAGALDGLPADRFALQDKAVLPVAREQVAGMRVEVGGQPRLVAARRTGPDGAPAWALTFPREAPLATARVGAALLAATSLRAVALADEGGGDAARRGLAPPARVVVLLGESGQELGRLEIGAPSGERTAVRSSTRPRIVEVATASLRAIPGAAEELEGAGDAADPGKAPAR